VKKAAQLPLLTLAAMVMLAQAALCQDTIDFNAVLKETQQTDRHNGKTVFVWFVPPEFWEQSAMSAGATREAAKSAFAPLHNYHLFIVGVADYKLGGASGKMDWVADADVRKNVVLRDVAGHTYVPLEKVSDAAQDLVNVMRPTFKNTLGPMAEGMHLLFFSTKDATGKEFGDPRQSGELSILISDIIDAGTARAYTWRLPLNAFSPPKYCPVGKERVEANWKYCPWHGNKLDAGTAPAPASTK
jgi:hypothetical protein